jgi:hypothetical protein
MPAQVEFCWHQGVDTVEAVRQLLERTGGEFRGTCGELAAHLGLECSAQTMGDRLRRSQKWFKLWNITYSAPHRNKGILTLKWSDSKK